MKTLEAVINHLIANEIRAQETRESLYQDIRSGVKDADHVCQELFTNERNASCQRVGFLLGQATAFRMDSDLLTRAQTFFVAQTSVTEVSYYLSNHQTYDGAVTPMTNGVAQSNDHIEMGASLSTDGMPNADTVHTSSGHDTSNRGFSNHDARLTMTSAGSGAYLAPAVNEEG